MFLKFKIGTRLIMSFSVIILASVIIWGVSVTRINGFVKQSEINYNYNTKGIMNSYEIGNALASIRIIMRDISLVQDVESRQKKYDAIAASYTTLIDNINKYKNEVLVLSETQEEKQYLDIIETNITEYMAAVEKSKAIGLEKDDIGLAVDSFMLDYTQNAVNAITAMNQLIEFSNNMSIIANDDAKEAGSGSVALLTGLLIIVLALAIILSYKITRSITKPTGLLLRNAELLAQGSFDFIDAKQGANDELGALTASFNKVTNVIMSLLNEMDKMSVNHEKGEIDAVIDTNKFTGVFSTVASRINEMVLAHININRLAMGCINEIVNGDFKADIEKLPGKKAFINEGIENVRGKIKLINSEIISMTEHALNGDLKETIDLNAYTGDWAELMRGLNELMNAIERPLSEAISVLEYVSLGNFDHMVEGDYKGDFLTMKNSINRTITNVASYINEISTILSSVSDDNNLNNEITREYVGSFSEIKIALNNIISKFNKIISDIFAASEQVAAGARLVSENSMILANGSSRQSASVEELNSTILTFNENIIQNAENAKKAEALATGSKNDALKGDQEMRSMLTSMDGINESSNNIANIIRVIDDIAFQTNLLALNAAVEAARAGDHGKGFAVVAEEVRNLAGRSQQSARETAGLIDESVMQVNEGTKMAGATAESFSSIVDGITKVSGIITDISQASDKQAEVIDQITAGVSEISDVVKENSATSEEAAAASQELSSQAEVLRNLVSVFKLK